MSDISIDSSLSTITVETSRDRQTAKPATPFRDVLAGSVNVLMTGAEVATSVVAGPVLAAAVRGAGSDVVAGISGQPATAVLGIGAAGGSGDLAGVMSSGDQGSGIAQAYAMQKESQAFNLQLLGLQQEVQNENQRFSTLSNVLRAKHDTAKAAVGNIRS